MNSKETKSLSQWTSCVFQQCGAKFGCRQSLAMHLHKRYRHTAGAITGRKSRARDSDAGRIRRNRCVKFTLSSLTTSDCRRSLPEHCRGWRKSERCAALMVLLFGVCSRQQTIFSSQGKKCGKLNFDKKKKKDKLKGKITCLELMPRCLEETKSSRYGENGEQKVKNVLWLW